MVKSPSFRLLRNTACAVAALFAIGLMASQANAQCSSSYGYSGGYYNSGVGYYSVPRYRSYSYNNWYPRSGYHSHNWYPSHRVRSYGYGSPRYTNSRSGYYYCPVRRRYIRY